MRRFVLAGVASVCAAAACSNFEATPPAETPADGGNGVESGADEVDAAFDVADAGDDSGVVVLVDDHFDGAGDCGWEPTRATAVIEPDAGRSGGACHVCATGVYGLVVRHLEPAQPGTYTLLYWVRSDPANSLPEWGGDIAYDADGGQPSAGSNSGTVGSSWSLAEIGPVTVSPTSYVEPRISLGPATSGCFYVDDVTFVRK